MSDERRVTEDWLEPRLVDVPAELADEIRRCVRRVLEARSDSGCPLSEAASGGIDVGASVSATLAAGALAAFDLVIRKGRGRENAVLLLAGDACLTYAFEACAEQAEDAAALARRLGLTGELGSRLLSELAGETPGA